MSISSWSNGIMAYSWIFRKRKGCRRGILSTMELGKFRKLILICVPVINWTFSLSPYRFCVITQECHMIGHTLSLGLELHLRLSLPFYCLVLLFVYEANAKKRTNWICNIWCPVKTDVMVMSSSYAVWRTTKICERKKLHSSQSWPVFFLFVFLFVQCVWLWFLSHLVYPQKQAPYPYPGYPQPQPMYPGPYYHGSQYGPYNNY